jgi:hypothetical protein
MLHTLTLLEVLRVTGLAEGPSSVLGVAVESEASVTAPQRLSVTALEASFVPCSACRE